MDVLVGVQGEVAGVLAGGGGEALVGPGSTQLVALEQGGAEARAATAAAATAVLTLRVGGARGVCGGRLSGSESGAVHPKTQDAHNE